jgi:hypothetical protein
MPDRGSDFHDKETAIDHQQQSHDGEAATQFDECTRGGNDTDRARHDRDLEQRLREIEIGIALDWI